MIKRSIDFWRELADNGQTVALKVLRSGQKAELTGRFLSTDIEAGFWIAEITLKRLTERKGLTDAHRISHSACLAFWRGCRHSAKGGIRGEESLDVLTAGGFDLAANLPKPVGRAWALGIFRRLRLDGKRKLGFALRAVMRGKARASGNNNLSRLIRRERVYLQGLEITPA